MLNAIINIIIVTVMNAIEQMTANTFILAENNINGKLNIQIYKYLSKIEIKFPFKIQNVNDGN